MRKLRRLVLAGTAVLAFPAAASAASCMDEVQRVSQQLGVQGRPAAPGATPPAEAPATTESRGVPPEASSRLSGTGAASGPAGRHSEAIASLQAARAGSAQGNEKDCLAQLAKARAAVEGK